MGVQGPDFLDKLIETSDQLVNWSQRKLNKKYEELSPKAKRFLHMSRETYDLGFQKIEKMFFSLADYIETIFKLKPEQMKSELEIKEALKNRITKKLYPWRTKSIEAFKIRDFFDSLEKQNQIMYQQPTAYLELRKSIDNNSKREPFETNTEKLFTESKLWGMTNREIAGFLIYIMQYAYEKDNFIEYKPKYDQYDYIYHNDVHDEYISAINLLERVLMGNLQKYINEANAGHERDTSIADYKFESPYSAKS